MRTMEQAFVEALVRAHADVDGYQQSLMDGYHAVEEVDGKDKDWYLTAEVTATMNGTWVDYR